MTTGFGGLAAWLTRLLIPTRCLLCQRLGEDTLCSNCRGRLEIVALPCLRCGRRRLTSYASPDCGECHGRSLGFERARSLLSYNSAGRRLLAEFKYQRRLAAGHALTALLPDWLAAGTDRLYGIPGLQLDAVVPVPMFHQRQRRRRFNQAEFIARRIGACLQVPCQPELLVRVRDTESQVGKSLNQRRENVRGAFAVPAASADAARGRIILLVDDVMTTGSTLRSCALALKRGGAAASYAATLFSTSHGVEPPDDDVPPPVGL